MQKSDTPWVNMCCRDLAGMIPLGIQLETNSFLGMSLIVSANGG